MKYELKEAVLDIKEAYLYYEEQRIGLENRFLDNLKTYLGRVQKYPEHYQIKRKPYREALIKDFPYLIIYETEENKVITYAIFNTWRNPNKKPAK